MISFSKQVKDELLNVGVYDYKVCLSTIILSIGSISFSQNDILLEIKSSNISLIRRTLTILKNYYSYANAQVIIRENKKFKNKNKIYILRIEKGAQKLLHELKLTSQQQGIFFELNIPKKIFEDDKTKKEFLRYLFISNGSINNPKIQKQYHLELIFNNINVLKEAKNIAKKYDINFKKTTRKNISALYLNKGEEIADFLKLIGSIDYMFEFENQRLLRDIRATENRLINAEIANETKKQTVALKQIEAINKLKKNNEINTLKDKTIEVANLREKNPNASLNELVDLFGGKISKSNLRHHLNLIVKKSEEL